MHGKGLGKVIMNDNDKRFSEQLPFYTNGTLNAEEMKFMKAYLANNPQAQSDIKFAAAMRDVVKQIGTDRAPDAGLARLLDDFRQIHQKSSMLDRIRASFKNWGLTPAFAVAATIVVIQSAVILNQQDLTPGSIYRSMTTEKIAYPQLKIIINNNASFSEVTILLRQYGCKIVAGPSESGELWIAVDDPGKLNNIQRNLIESNLVDEATLLP
jgi:hypothetical protein